MTASPTRHPLPPPAIRGPRQPSFPHSPTTSEEEMEEKEIINIPVQNNVCLSTSLKFFTESPLMVTSYESLDRHSRSRDRSRSRGNRTHGSSMVARQRGGGASDRHGVH